ncbi:MAG: MotA/TolQ/ExbB proton channel family protein [bacterium]
MNLYELYMQGGIVMHPILLCSILMVMVIIERAIVLKRAKIDTGQFMLKLRSVVQRGGVEAGLTFCSKSSAPIANLMKKGLSKYNEGTERVREAIENAGKEEVYHLETRLGMLASIAGIAPLLGFLGTVTGMIQAFMMVQKLGGNASPADLAGGIWEALLTTAFGLFVGIPALGFYNYFITKVGRFVFELESASEEFLDLARAGALENSITPHEKTKAVATEEADEFFKKKG